MKITIENVTAELANQGIPTTGCYSKIPTLTYSLIINILHFGESSLENSTLGSKVKAIALELAKKDGRKSVYCPVTFKNILN